MHYRRPGDGPLPQRPDYAQRALEFPGPVVIACTPPDGTLTLLGFEDTDDHPWAIDVTYAVPGRKRLRVRTVRGAIDWPQRIRSLETLATNMINTDGIGPGDDLGRFVAEPQTPETPTSIVIDGESVPATRMDLPNCSGIGVEWRGQRIFCTGEPGLLDTLELRTGTGPDFTRFMDEFDEYIARRRAGG